MIRRESDGHAVAYSRKVTAVRSEPQSMTRCPIRYHMLVTDSSCVHKSMKNSKTMGIEIRVSHLSHREMENSGGAPTSVMLMWGTQRLDAAQCACAIQHHVPLWKKAVWMCVIARLYSITRSTEQPLIIHLFGNQLNISLNVQTSSPHSNFPLISTITSFNISLTEHRSRDNGYSSCFQDS